MGDKKNVFLWVFCSLFLWVFTWVFCFYGFLFYSISNPRPHPPPRRARRCSPSQGSRSPPDYGLRLHTACCRSCRSGRSRRSSGGSTSRPQHHRRPHRPHLLPRVPRIPQQGPPRERGWEPPPQPQQEPGWEPGWEPPPVSSPRQSRNQGRRWFFCISAFLASFNLASDHLLQREAPLVIAVFVGGFTSSLLASSAAAPSLRKPRHEIIVTRRRLHNLGNLLRATRLLLGLLRRR